MRADADQRANPQQQQEVAAMTPQQSCCEAECAHHQPETQEHEPEALRVLDARLDPRPELVVAVEEPVAEAAQYLRGGAGVGHHFVGLGVTRHRQAVGRLQGQPRDPPQRHANGENTDPRRGRRSPSDSDAALHQRRVQQPQHRRDPGEHQAGGVHASRGERAQGEQGRIAPSADTPGFHGQSDHPAQGGPRKQHR